MGEDDFLKTIKATLYERVANPLLGSFVISWLIWNHRMVWVLFSSDDYTIKFKYIDSVLYATTWECLVFLLLGPLFTALAYIYLFPFVSTKVYKYHLERAKDLKGIRQKIEDETPLTQEEAIKIRREMRSMEIKHQEEVDAIRAKYDEKEKIILEQEKASSEIERKLSKKQEELSSIEVDFRKQLNSKNSELKKRENEMSQLVLELERLQREKEKLLSQAKIDKSNQKHISSKLADEEDLFLKKLAEDPHGETPVHTLSNITGLSKIRLDVLLADLRNGDYVEEYQDEYDDTVVALTNKGKRYVLDRGYAN